jgi:hypothetical protein
MPRDYGKDTFYVSFDIKLTFKITKTEVWIEYMKWLQLDGNLLFVDGKTTYTVKSYYLVSKHLAFSYNHKNFKEI